jgi:tetratricopeptide (TPR) repeat protein
LREHPDATELLLARADLAEDRGGAAAALAIRRKAHAAKPALRSTRLALARSLALTGTDLELARELAEEALAQARSVDALELQALVLAARGEFAGALSSADEGLAKAPPAARDELLFRRAEALAGLGQAEAAATALAEARRLAGADPRAQRSTARVEKLLSAPSS